MQRSQVRSEPHREEGTRAAWKRKTGLKLIIAVCSTARSWVSDGFNGINGSTLLPIVTELSHCLIVNAQSSFVVQANN